MLAPLRSFFLNLKRTKPLLATVIFLLLNTAEGWAQEACMLMPVSLAQRTQQATLVVEAKVTAQQTYWNAAHQNIYTQNTLEVYKTLKGTAPQTTYIITEGGRVGDTYHAFSGTLQLQLGEQGIFFLVLAAANQQPPDQPARAFTVYSSSQGFIRYDLNTHEAVEPFQIYPNIAADVYPPLQKLTGAGYQIIRPNADLENILPNATDQPGGAGNLRLKAVPAIAGFSPDTVAAGANRILTIRGQNFGNARGAGSVQFRNADNGGANFIQLLETDYITWSDTEIKVRVSGKNDTNNTLGSGNIRVTNDSRQSANSTQRLVIQFVASAVIYEGQGFVPRLVNANGQGGYTFRVSPGFAQNIPAVAAFNRALNTWSCHTGVNWQTAAPAPLEITADDNVNVVRFDTGNELPTGILARCISRYNGCGNNTPTQWRVSEMDLIFNTEVFWNFSSGPPELLQFDFETVTLHEMGHGHQLNHVIKPGAVMHYAIAREQETRRLDARTDIAGGQYTLSQGIVSNQCGPRRMTPQPVTDCPLPPAILTFTAEPRSGLEIALFWNLANAGQPAYFTVERSKDAAVWQGIGTVRNTAAPNNSTTPYTFSDTNPWAGASYYRLKIVNADHTFTYSALVRINLPVPPGLAIIPNPLTGNTLRLQYVTATSGRLTIQLYDEVGRLLQTFNRSYQPHTDVLELPVGGLSAGLYVLVYSDGNQTHRQKFIKLSREAGP